MLTRATSSPCCAIAWGPPALSTKTCEHLTVAGAVTPDRLGPPKHRADQTGLRPNAIANVFTVRCSFSSLDIAVTRSLHSSADTPSFA